MYPAQSLFRAHRVSMAIHTAAITTMRVVTCAGCSSQPVYYTHASHNLLPGYEQQADTYGRLRMIVIDETLSITAEQLDIPFERAGDRKGPV